MTKGNLELPTFQQILFENYMKMIEKTNFENSQLQIQEEQSMIEDTFEIPQNFVNSNNDDTFISEEKPSSLNSSGSSDYIETENEKKRKREIEEELEAKKLKKEKKNKKKKLF